MNRFWDALTRPLLEIMKPKSIVEIGADDGKQTRLLLEYCQQHEAVLHSIDPLPRFDVQSWQEHYGKHFVFHRALSLNALSLIHDLDLVLIDGDHNWYTVYHELKLIEKNTVKDGKPLPLIILHDVGWPYGRRDLYYNPETIPAAYLKPHKQLGIKPDSTELAEEGGINPHLSNSIYENNLQSGVLTAVEDFMEEAKEPLVFLTIPPFHGLGILFSEAHNLDPDFSSFTTELVSNEPLLELLKQIEEDRITLVVEKETSNRTIALQAQKIKGLDSEFRKISRHLEKKEEEIARQEADYSRRYEELQKSLNQRVEKKEEEIARQEADFSRRYEELQKSLNLRAQQLDELEKAFASSRHRTTMLQEHVDKLEKKLQEKNNQVLELQKALDQNRQMNTRYLNDLKLKQAELKKKEHTIKQLEKWIKHLKEDFQTLQHTHRWKLGNALVNFMNRLRFQKKTPFVIKRINRTFASFESSNLERRDKQQGNKMNSSQDVTQLIHWIRQLETNTQNLLHTKRWKIGNKLVGTISAMRGRSRSSKSLMSIKEVFTQFHSWKPSHEKEMEDILTLSCWIQELQTHFEALINSKRWKLGDQMVSLFNRALLRRKSPVVVKNIRDVFLKHDEWQKNRLDQFNLALQYSMEVSVEEAKGERYELAPPLY